MRSERRYRRTSGGGHVSLATVPGPCLLDMVIKVEPIIRKILYSDVNIPFHLSRAKCFRRVDAGGD